MKRVTCPFLVLFVFLAVSVMPAHAGPVIDRILQKGVLTLGTTGHYPPLTVKDKDGRFMGFDIDIARMMADSIGVKLQIKQMSISEIFPAIEKGEIDMALAGLTITPKRNLRVVFLGPYYVTGQSILAEKSVVAHVKGPQDIDKPGFSLAVTRGTTSEQVARMMLPRANIIPVKDMDTAFKMVVNHKAQALMADEPFCVVMAFRHKSKKLAVSAPFTFEPLGVAMPQADLLWINWVDNFLLNLNANGKLKELKEYWFANPSWMDRLPASGGLFHKAAL